EVRPVPVSAGSGPQRVGDLRLLPGPLRRLDHARPAQARHPPGGVAAARDRGGAGPRHRGAVGAPLAGQLPQAHRGHARGARARPPPARRRRRAARPRTWNRRRHLMLTGILIGVLALIAFLYVALPLLAPSQADPLPDDRDPILVDLSEEREALFRAITELDAREDLAAERRQSLRERYEAKAAKVLARIDAREQELAARRRRAPAEGEGAGRRRVPYGAVAVRAALVAIGAVVPAYVLPRVGQDATITTADLDVARQLQAQQRAVEQDPSVTNLL